MRKLKKILKKKWNYKSSPFHLHAQTDAQLEFKFAVKFYPPDPAQLQEDITRYENDL